MHHGVVGEYLEPGVTLIVLGANRGTVPVDFIIDTGCTEEVILPQDLIDRLNLIRVDDITLALADGTVDTFARYNARIMWHGNSKEVVAVNMGSEPILGMQLLQGSNLSVDAVFGGSVTITELPGQP